MFKFRKNKAGIRPPLSEQIIFSNVEEVNRQWQDATSRQLPLQQQMQLQMLQHKTLLLSLQVKPTFPKFVVKTNNQLLALLKKTTRTLSLLFRYNLHPFGGGYIPIHSTYQRDYTHYPALGPQQPAPTFRLIQHPIDRLTDEIHHCSPLAAHDHVAAHF